MPSITCPVQSLSPDEIEMFGFTDLKHGLVAFDSEGNAEVKIPGHQFGREEIEKAVQEVLPADS